ncbi:MAG: flavodoxin family protein [Campylobacter sp.]|nr:flavodoxin family protein [Campylobacter sp.]
MKKVYAINASPRKNANTAKMLDSALDGVKSAFDEEIITKRINLFDLNFTSCKSCFACKLKSEKFKRKCALKDDLSSVLEEILNIDGLIIGSPIYYRTITGQLHSFYERLFFPYMQYKHGYPTLVQKKFPTACIYTMNVSQDEMLRDGYRQNMELWEMFLGAYFQKPLIAYAFNTYQFSDYSKYVCEVFDEKDKAKYRDTQFPIDLQNAFNLGKKLLKQNL